MSVHMSHDEFLAAVGVAPTSDVGYIAKPNVVDVVLSDRLAPDDLMPTSFIFAFVDADHIVFAVNRRRGLEIPGGHREWIEGLYETAAISARRELKQETEYKVGPLKAVGFMRSRSSGVAPDDNEYPFPNASQQFFAGKVEGAPKPYVENDECLTPQVLTHAQAEARLEDRTLALYREARRLTFGL